MLDMRLRIALTCTNYHSACSCGARKNGRVSSSTDIVLLNNACSLSAESIYRGVHECRGLFPSKLSNSSSSGSKRAKQRVTWESHMTRKLQRERNCTYSLPSRQRMRQVIGATLVKSVLNWCASREARSRLRFDHLLDCMRGIFIH